MARILAVIFLCAALTACKWGMEDKPKPEPEKSPLLTSLQDSSLPCFKCHRFDKFSGTGSGRFSHEKHLGFGVHCNQCHLIKAHREMNLNKSTCDNCHKLTNFSYAGAGMPVSFSHQKHAAKYGCNECHSAIFQMKKGATRITMDEMYKGNSCGKCHNGKITFSSKDCAKCHNVASALKKDFQYASGGMKPAVFSHELHTGMFDCAKCHASLFKYKKGGSGMKMSDLYQNKFCSTCHDGKSAFDVSECQRCHK